jgi:hypothetical protein
VAIWLGDPTLYHVYVGSGLPWAVHVAVIVCPSSIVIFVGLIAIMVGGSEMCKNKIFEM